MAFDLSIWKPVVLYTSPYPSRQHVPRLKKRALFECRVPNRIRGGAILKCPRLIRLFASVPKSKEGQRHGGQPIEEHAGG